ncbi:hypothetical protein [Deinococcus puniceus]|uniref:hypothetical protein n=1 Tax=Deinococcus puniceus TaxID=1182568 RepID=UPI000ACFBF17|nr:hypothetical protein [Deinococcus puniceus]
MKPFPAHTQALLPKIPLVEQETSNFSSNGMSFITKMIFEDPYWRITFWFDEYGEIIKENKRTLD